MAALGSLRLSLVGWCRPLRVLTPLALWPLRDLLDWVSRSGGCVLASFLLKTLYHLAVGGSHILMQGHRWPSQVVPTLVPQLGFCHKVS